MPNGAIGRHARESSSGWFIGYRITAMKSRSGENQKGHPRISCVRGLGHPSAAIGTPG